MRSDRADSEPSDGHGIGAPVRRREDRPLLTGDAQYTDDITARGETYAAVHRSQRGHAIIASVETGTAAALDGVIDVFTAADVDSAVTPGGIPVGFSAPDDPPASVRREHQPRWPMLAEDRVRYAGEPVAVVVAEDRATAHDAVGAIDVEYEPVAAVTDPVAARGDDADALHEAAPDNVAIDWEVGDESAVDAAFDEADHTVELNLVNQRLAHCPMEPRTMLAEYTASTGRLHVTMSTQVPHGHRSMLAEALGLPENKVEVKAPDVGGGFGLKSKYYPAEIATAWCSTQVERPVKWQATRLESFAADVQGRGHDTTAALAVDDDGTIHALRAETDVDLGAYVSKVAPLHSTGAYGFALSNQYAIPEIYCRTIATFTNKAPLDAYRGAGRPEAAYVVERLVHTAARRLGLDPATLRRRNFIPTDAFPHEVATGVTYDSGDYGRALDRLLDLIEYEQTRTRQARLREENRYLGIGLACYIETAAVDASYESSTVRVRPDGTVTAHLGSADQGQSHETTFVQILSDELGVPPDDIAVHEGTTETVPEGVGTFASRTATMAGTALVESAGHLIDKARRVAAHRLEVAPSDLEFDAGEFHVTGAPERSLSIAGIADVAYDTGALPDGMEPGLEASALGRADMTVPFGAHAAVVEVTPASGEIDIEQYAAVDDCGIQLNPLVVEGQIHGAIAQGIGQALLESIVYDDNGTLQTGSLQDYAVPKAPHLPEFDIDHTETPSPRNPLGVKGVGESGTIGSPPAITNAVVDALAPFDVEHLDMPLTPETVWRAAHGNGA